MSTSSKLISVAIDFGTTFSGYAYSTRANFVQDPGKVFTTNWNDGQSMITTKAPTAVLFRPDGTLFKFRYDAETKYASLVGEDAHKGWSYFSRFKMLLFHKKVTKRTTLHGENGCSMNALKVVSAVIRYFKNMFLDELPEKIKEITLDDINWAGKPEKRLILVGGSSVLQVDANWYKLFEELFGSDVVIELSEDFTEKLDLDRLIELKKRVIQPSDAELIRIKLPSVLFDIFAEKNENVSFHEKLKDSKFEDKVQCKRGSLAIPNTFLEETYWDSVSKITSHVQRKLLREELKDVKSLILVGGLSESEIVRSSLKSSFPEYTLFMPQEAAASVLRGAVIFGHCQDFIMSHKLPNSYGVSTNVPFDVNIHREDFKVKERDGSLMCFDVFHPLVRKGEKIVVKETTITKEFRSHRPGMSRVSVDIYKTPQDIQHGRVIYTLDCEWVCTLDIDVENIQYDKKTTVIMQMRFGET
ncbi:HS12B-like protein, partial [Mya arenaria]